MYELQVEGMSCNHCVTMVTKSVKEIDSGAQIDVDLTTHKVRVDSKAGIDDVKSAVTEAGYQVTDSKVV